MIHSLLIGLVAGQRGITPLAALVTAARRKTLDHHLPLSRLLDVPLVQTGVLALAAGEYAGDKMKTAPDRIVPIGLAVRTVTAGYAGAALAPKEKRVLGAALAVGAALASSFVGWKLRVTAMERYGQTLTGAVEDAIVLASGIAIADPKLLSRG